MKRINGLCLSALFALLFGCASNHDTKCVANNALDINGKPSTAVTPIEAEGLPNLFKVSDDVYRSAQPKKGGLTTAKALGIKTVLSLRETKVDPELEEEEDTDLNLVHIPIVTWSVKDENIIDALKVLRDAPKPVLIHCRHGADRTGLIVAMYRMVFQNWSKSCALNELMNGDFGFHSIWDNIPDEIEEADIDAIKAELFGDNASNEES